MIDLKNLNDETNENFKLRGIELNPSLSDLLKFKKGLNIEIQELQAKFNENEQGANDKSLLKLLKNN